MSISLRTGLLRKPVNIAHARRRRGAREMITGAATFGARRAAGRAARACRAGANGSSSEHPNHPEQHVHGPTAEYYWILHSEPKATVAAATMDSR